MADTAVAVPPVAPAAAAPTPDAKAPAAAAPTPAAAAPAAGTGTWLDEVKAEAPAAKPIKYDLKPPKESPLDATALEKIAAFAGEHGLSQDQAQRLVERESAMSVESETNRQVTFKNLTADWLNEIKADRDFGGEKFADSAALANRFLQRFGDKELTDTLTASGLMNNPRLFKMLVRGARAISDDVAVQAKSNPAQKPELKDRLYKTTQTKPKE